MQQRVTACSSAACWIAEQLIAPPHESLGLVGGRCWSSLPAGVVARCVRLLRLVPGRVTTVLIGAGALLAARLVGAAALLLRRCEGGAQKVQQSVKSPKRAPPSRQPSVDQEKKRPPSRRKAKKEQRRDIDYRRRGARSSSPWLPASPQRLHCRPPPPRRPPRRLRRSRQQRH